MCVLREDNDAVRCIPEGERRRRESERREWREREGERGKERERKMVQ